MFNILRLESENQLPSGFHFKIEMTLMACEWWCDAQWLHKAHRVLCQTYEKLDERWQSLGIDDDDDKEIFVIGKR